MKPTLALLAALLPVLPPTCAVGVEAPAAPVQSLDGDGWRIATDPKSEGREARWFAAPREDARLTKVPWIIQDAFPGYHGVAWYWREFAAPTNPHAGGRCLLRFWAVDYLAEVWLNGVRVGGHEGGESPFVLDVTPAIRPGATNLLAVRVLNPTHERIDGIVLNETPHRNKALPYRAGSAWDQGGIVDSVELLVSPPVRVADLFAQPDWTTGVVRVRAAIRNDSPGSVDEQVVFTVAPAAGGESVATERTTMPLAAGETIVEARLHVPCHRLWQLNDPFLYRVTARVATGPLDAVDEQSVRFGFRDFRFEDGAFRLNGRRLFLRCSHTGNCCPVGLELPHDPDLLRRDLLNVKVMGFNAIRFISGVAKRYQLDLCDEIGLMVYEEAYAAWCLESSPKMAERYDESLFGMVRRDRNHPCVVIWGLLNETSDGPVFRHAAAALPGLRDLDATRMVMLNSGRWDARPAGDAEPPELAGLQAWRTGSGSDPNVTHNPTDRPIAGLGVRWEPGRLALHPGPAGEYSVVRWTCHAPGGHEVRAAFEGIAGKATTDAHVLHNGRPLHEGGINTGGGGNRSSFARTVALNAGDRLDFAVGFGNNHYGGDTTALDVSIRRPDSGLDEAAGAYTLKANPSGPWSYGWLASGARPDAATFRPYRVARLAGAPNPPAPREFGSLSNPGTREWQDVLDDQHPYQRVPHTAPVIRALRTIGGGGNPMFVSEYGVGSAVDLWRAARHYERLGKEGAEDARFYRDKMDRFLADWERWGMAECFATPQEFFAASLRRMAAERLHGMNALRANPAVVGYSLTGTVDQGMTGEGLFTTFRELKPGTVDAVFEALAPLRLCLFADPGHVYRGASVRCEAVLANEDVLAPGGYPVRLLVVGPRNERVFEKVIEVHVTNGAPFAVPIFAEDVAVNGPSGRYRFLASLERGGAATGGEAVFFVADRAEMPAVSGEVGLAGGDAELEKWLGDRGVRCRAFASGDPAQRGVILVSGTAPASEELWRRVERGATAVFLTPGALGKGEDPLGRLPLKNRGTLANLRGWLYHKDEWAKAHPVFDGLPCGGMMDYDVYRAIIPDLVLVGQDPPSRAIAGANDASCDYSSGLLLAEYRFGEGRFILNTLLVRENLGPHPVAERLLRNLLNHAAGPVTPAPAAGTP